MMNQEGFLHTCTSFSASGPRWLHSWYMRSRPFQQPVKTNDLSAGVVVFAMLPRATELWDRPQRDSDCGSDGQPNLRLSSAMRASISSSDASLQGECSIACVSFNLPYARSAST